MRAHKWHGENQTVMLFNLPQPMGLVAVHPARQPAGNKHSKLFLFCSYVQNLETNYLSPLDDVGENHCLRSPCTHICLLSAVGPAYYSCACPSGWTLAADQITCTRGLHPAKSTQEPFSCGLLECKTDLHKSEKYILVCIQISFFIQEGLCCSETCYFAMTSSSVSLDVTLRKSYLHLSY